MKRHKVIIVGCQGVGKSSLEECCLGKVAHYEPFRNPEFSYAFKEIKDCVLNIWDIKDEKEDCRKVNVRLFKNAHIVIMVFDITKRKSFENLDEWVDAIIAHNNLDLLPPTIIVGNKKDLRETANAAEVVTKEEGLEYATFLSEAHEVPVTYIETSVIEKEGTNVLPEILYDMVLKFEQDPKFKEISLDPSTRALVN